MGFYIPDPKIGVTERLRLWVSAYRAIKKCGPPAIDDSGFLSDQQVSLMRAKATQAFLIEKGRIGLSRQHKRLIAAWDEHQRIAQSLKGLRSEQAALASEAERQAREELQDESEIRSRARARARRIEMNAAPQAAAMIARMSQLEREAEEEHDLQGYRSLRLEKAQKLQACAVRHYQWPAEYYAVKISQISGLKGEIGIRPLAFSFDQELQEVLPDVFPQVGDAALGSGKGDE